MPKLRPSYADPIQPYALITVRGGKIQGAYLTSSAQVLVVDLDEFEGLTRPDRQAKAFHGIRQRRLSNVGLDELLHEIITEPSTVDATAPPEFRPATDEEIASVGSGETVHPIQPNSAEPAALDAVAQAVVADGPSKAKLLANHIADVVGQDASKLEAVLTPGTPENAAAIAAAQKGNS